MPQPNLVKESKKYKTYTNKLTDQTYPRIIVVSIQEMYDGNKMNLPTSTKVLREAERKIKDIQQEMNFDFLSLLYRSYSSFIPEPISVSLLKRSGYTN